MYITMIKRYNTRYYTYTTLFNLALYLLEILKESYCKVISQIYTFPSHCQLLMV